jgi:hypothetical protein
MFSFIPIPGKPAEVLSLPSSPGRFSKVFPCYKIVKLCTLFSPLPPVLYKRHPEREKSGEDLEELRMKMEEDEVSELMKKELQQSLSEELRGLIEPTLRQSILEGLDKLKMGEFKASLIQRTKKRMEEKLERMIEEALNSITPQDVSGALLSALDRSVEEIKKLLEGTANKPAQG